MDRVELRRRMNMSTPIIDKRMLQGGSSNINMRKEIDRYSKDMKIFNEKIKNQTPITEGLFSMSEEPEPVKPKLKKTRFSEGWF